MKLQSLRNLILLALLLSGTQINAQLTNNVCAGADPFCTGTTYNFPAGVNAGTAEAGANYGCLYSQPNPAWYFLRIGTSGTLEIEMHSTPQYDIDFACWGPFTSPTAPCVAQLTAGSGLSSHAAPGPSTMYPSLNMIDCSYSTSWQEWCYIPNAVAGQYYILLITNYSNQPCNIVFSQTSGTGTSDCGILAPPVTGDTVCVGETIQLTVNNPTSGATYSWTGPNGFTSNQINPTIPNATLANSGTYSMTISMGGQTSPAVTCNVLVNPNPTVTISPANPTTCPGAPVTLTPSASTGLAWFVWNTGAQGTGSINVSPTATTTYSVTGTDQNGCSGTASVTVTMNPDLNISVIPANPMICIGASIDLTATGGSSFTWSPSATLSSDTGATVSATPPVTTTYTVTGTDASMCTGSTTITVVASAGPNISVLASPEHICPGDTSILTIVGAATNYSWAPNNGLSNTTGQTTHAYPLTTTTYTATADNNGCISTTQYTLAVKPLPNVDFTSDIRDGCEGLMIHFTDLTTPDVQSWYWNFGDSYPYGNTSVMQNPFHYYADPGTYDVTLSVVSVDGCKMGITFQGFITVYPNPIAEFSLAPEIVNELEPTIWFQNNSIGAMHYLWDFGEPSVVNNYSNAVNPIHTYSDTGTYYPVLIAVTDHGCSDTTSHKVIVEPNVAFYIPNAFTPNGDERNGRFFPRGEGIIKETFIMRVFDRWGHLILTTNDMDNGWDGTLNGKTAPEGIYSWHISFTDVKFKAHNLKGMVTLVK